MDIFFSQTNDPVVDRALMDAMRRNKMVIMAQQAEVVNPRINGVEPILPDDVFLEAARTNWGVAFTLSNRPLKNIVVPDVPEVKNVLTGCIQI